MNYTGVIFDLDGTILNTAPDIINACNHTLEKFGYKSVSDEILMSKITSGMTIMLIHAINSQGGKYDENELRGKFRDEFAKFYTENINVYTKTFDGIQELIDSFYKHHIKMAIVTNKYEAMAKKLIANYKFSKQIDLILGCDSCPLSKPDPMPILMAIEKCKMQRDKTIYIGDHLNDILASKNAHISSALALWGYGKNEVDDYQSWGADYLCEKVDDFKRIILS